MPSEKKQLKDLSLREWFLLALDGLDETVAFGLITDARKSWHDAKQSASDTHKDASAK